VDSLPSSYGVDLIVLQPRDPWWIYTYWELTPAAVARGRAKLGPEQEGAAWILRVYEEETSHSFDIPLAPGAGDWTIHVQPDRGWIVEIGLNAPSGRFVVLARSNPARTPPDRPSDRVDEDWGLIESMPEGWSGPSSGERPA